MTAVVNLLAAPSSPGRAGPPGPGRMLLETAGRTYPHCLGPSPKNASSH